MQSGRTLTGLMGSTDISSVGTTVTGAILNLAAQPTYIGSKAYTDTSPKLALDITTYRFFYMKIF